MLWTVGTTSAAAAVNITGRHGAALPFAACQVRHLDQLKYLAKVMGFEVQITNIPKVCLAFRFSVLNWKKFSIGLSALVLCVKCFKV